MAPQVGWGGGRCGRERGQDEALDEAAGVVDGRQVPALVGVEQVGDEQSGGPLRRPRRTVGGEEALEVRAEGGGGLPVEHVDLVEAEERQQQSGLVLEDELRRVVVLQQAGGDDQRPGQRVAQLVGGIDGVEDAAAVGGELSDGERKEQVLLAAGERPVERCSGAAGLLGDVAEGRLGDAPAPDERQRGIEDAGLGLGRRPGRVDVDEAQLGCRGGHG